MTHTVVNELEHMAAELEYYKSKKIFTDAEIEAIVKKRKEFEEVLSVKKKISAFLLYIEYEAVLQRIYNKRVKNCEKRKNYVQNRIYNLYRRAEFSFPGKEELHISQLEYAISVCDRKKIKELSIALPRRLAGRTDAWITAANGLRGLGEIEGSRVLLQRALRVIKNRREILEGYIELERKNPEEGSEKIIEILKKQLSSPLSEKEAAAKPADIEK